MYLKDIYFSDWLSNLIDEDTIQVLIIQDYLHRPQFRVLPVK